MPKDLRTFIADWEERHPEDFVRSDAPIRVRWEVTALQAKLEREGKHPVLIFHRPFGLDGEVAPHRLITNLMASRRRSAAALGVGPREVALRYSERSLQVIPPIVVDPHEAPVKEIITRGDQVDLGRFPVVWHHEMDPGPYITAGNVTTIDPETGTHNSSFQRCWVKARNRTGLFPSFESHNWLNISKHWEAGKDAPVAIWVGHHPAALVGAQVKLGYPDDHYRSIGGLLGEPLRLTPTETFGRDLLVPADAEVVIEGRIPREHFEAEGPFGEYPRYSGPQAPRPVIEVECVTFRKDAYWHDFAIGHLDASIPGTFAAEANIYQLLKKQVPEVVNVRRAPYGHNIYIQVRKVREGIIKNVILGALLPAVSKYVFVFEEDVDIFDDSQILWAFGTRTQLDQDMIVVPGASGSPLDPSCSEFGLGTKVGFDCTRPCPPEAGLPPLFSPVLSIPEEVSRGVKVEDHISKEQLDKVTREEVYW